MRTSPRERVVLPVAESPTTPRMIGRAIYVTPGLALVAGCAGFGRRLAVLVREQRAGEDVLGLDRDKVLTRELITSIVQATGLTHAGAVDGVADGAPVGEARALDAALDVLAKRFARLVGELVLLLLEHELGDLGQLRDREVGEVQVVRDARAHAGVRAKERVHPVLVAREDDDEVVALGFHDLQQDLDRLLPVVALVLRAVQVARVVDEEYGALRPLEHVAGLGGGVGGVLPDEVVARDGNNLPPG